MNTTKLESSTVDNRNIDRFEAKLRTGYSTEYNELFEMILQKSEGDFIRTLTSNICTIGADEYSDDYLDNEDLNGLIKKQEHQCYLNRYKLDKEQILKAIKSNPNGSVLNYSFRKHCNYQTNNLNHNCTNSNTTININDKFIECALDNNQFAIVCTNCNSCYYTNCVQLYCEFCSINYYTSLDKQGNDSENVDTINNIQPATWEKYHCKIIYNDQMPCVACKQGKLYYDIENNFVFCQVCDFISNPKDIIWTCIVCKNEFVSNIKIYNPGEYKTIKKALKAAFMKRINSTPENYVCPCTEENITLYYHKTGCDGILYQGYHNNKEMVICSKCNSMAFKEKFIWTCPKCKKRFRDNINDNMVYNGNTYNSLQSGMSNTEEGGNILSQSTSDTMEKDLKFMNCPSNNVVPPKMNIGEEKDTFSEESKIISKIGNSKGTEIDTESYEIISQTKESPEVKEYVVKEIDGYSFFAMKKLQKKQNIEKNVRLQHIFSMQNRNITKVKGIQVRAKEIIVLEELGINDLDKEIYSLQKTKEPIPEKDIIEIVRQISNACAFLQLNNYAFAKITPSSIEIHKDKQYKLNNFFDLIATPLQGFTPKQLGSNNSYDIFIDPMLMTTKPEIINIYKADVFSLGLIILYLRVSSGQIVQDVVNIYYIKGSIIEKNRKGKEMLKDKEQNIFNFSDDFIEITYNMLNYNISKRFDFFSVNGLFD